MLSFNRICKNKYEIEVLDEKVGEIFIKKRDWNYTSQTYIPESNELDLLVCSIYIFEKIISSLESTDIRYSVNKNVITLTEKFEDLEDVFCKIKEQYSMAIFQLNENKTCFSFSSILIEELKNEIMFKIKKCNGNV